MHPQSRMLTSPRTHDQHSTPSPSRPPSPFAPSGAHGCGQSSPSAPPRSECWAPCPERTANTIRRERASRGIAPHSFFPARFGRFISPPLRETRGGLQFRAPHIAGSSFEHRGQVPDQRMLVRGRQGLLEGVEAEPICEDQIAIHGECTTATARTLSSMC